jgi:hypothetical protein
MGNESSLALLQERVAEQRRMKALADTEIKRVRADGTNMLVILQAARSLPPEFHVEDLAVACWKLDPARFGMRKHQFPDMHRLRPCLDGERGLIRRGILESAGHNLLRLGPLAAKRTEDPMPRS